MSRTSSHPRNALVSVSRTYVTMYVDDDDEAISVLRTPPRATNTKIHYSNAPGAQANYSISLRTDLYARIRNKHYHYGPYIILLSN